MKKALLSQTRVITALAVVLVVTSLLPAQFVQPVTSTPHDVVMAILTPLSAPLNALAGAVRSPNDLTIKPGSDEQLQRELRGYEQRHGSLWGLQRAVWPRPCFGVLRE